MGSLRFSCASALQVSLATYTGGLAAESLKSCHCGLVQHGRTVYLSKVEVVIPGAVLDIVA